MFKKFDHFIASIAFLLLLPLAPLGIEWVIKGAISAESANLVAATYGVAIAIGSASPSFIALGILSSLFFSFQYGRLLDGHGLPSSGFWATVGIWAIFAYHMVERFIIHVVDGKDFDLFKRP